MTHPRRPERAWRASLLPIALGLALLGLPTPAEAARGYRLDLYRPGDFVAQTNLVQCVGASMQMMINLVEPKDDRTAATQRRYWALARALSPPRPSGIRRRGASVHGWAAGLNQLGRGPYRVAGFPTIEQALAEAARSMRLTGRPVGLLVWAGRHAWVMSGFAADADPRDGDVRVSHVNVLDPLYPRGSSTWGPSPRPGASLSVAALGRVFVPRRRTWSGPLSGMYVIVMPVLPSLRVTWLRSGRYPI
ncbi:MAG TPA: hypothetical protein VFK38_02145 [Candidatus Limnocylindrales bacterium]|nr:hypothetical protein [Candidatus Limnocylindrales bacterium]